MIRGNRTLQDCWSSRYGNNDIIAIYLCTCCMLEHSFTCMLIPAPVNSWNVYCALAAMPAKKNAKRQGTFGNALISSDLPNFISAEVLGWHHNHDILPCKFVTPTIPTAKQRVAVPAVQLKSRDPLAPINKAWMIMDLLWGGSNQDKKTIGTLVLD